MKKLPYTINDNESLPQMNQNWETLYRHKMESSIKRDESGTITYVFQVAEHGEVDFSPTGSPTIARTFALTEPYTNMIYANAHAKSINCVAAITDLTNTSVTIEARTISGTANFSDVTTAIKVYYQVIGNVD